MNTQQMLMALLLVGMLALFIWNKWRFDLVAGMVLLASVIVGIVPANKAFSGFSHSAVLTVAAVLVMTEGLIRSGFTDMLSHWAGKVGGGPAKQTALLAGGTALLSSVMNNVGALAIFMPVANKMARSSKYSPSRILMWLAFASVYGGTITLIGSPPNLIASNMFEKYTGQGLGMFGFVPVGLAISVACVAASALLGRFVMPDREKQSSQEEMFELSSYTSKVVVAEGSALVDKTMGDVDAGFFDKVLVLGLIRDGKAMPAPKRYDTFHMGDELIVETDAKTLAEFIKSGGFTLPDIATVSEEELTVGDQQIQELVLGGQAGLIGSTAQERKLASRYGIRVLGVSRHGARLSQSPEQVRTHAGDVLLVQGAKERIAGFANDMGLLPLAPIEVDVKKMDYKKMALAIGIFTASVLLASFEVYPPEVAFMLGAVAMVLTKILTLPQAYKAVNWNILVLLATLIPFSNAIETTGLSKLIAAQLTSVSQGLPMWLVMLLMMAVTIALTSVVNNAAAMLLMGPIAADLALRLGISPAPFLMAAFVAASTSHLTPIGHPANTVVMGPGGYTFADYFKPGLLLALVTLAVSVPLILMLYH